MAKIKWKSKADKEKKEKKAPPTLEERIEALEKTVSKLEALLKQVLFMYTKIKE